MTAFSTSTLRSKYPGHSLVVTDDWQVNILNLEGVVWKPLDGVELQSHVTFIAPPRRNIPGQIVRSIRFGGFDVEWKEEKFIIFIASVGVSLVFPQIDLNVLAVGGWLLRSYAALYSERG